jgi:hypothetical protein
MPRILCALPLLMLIGCADQSKGAALNECRMQYYLRDPAAQGRLIPDCMMAKSFLMLTPCSPTPNEHDWDWQAAAFPFDNPQCYQPLGAKAWMATALSPM